MIATVKQHVVYAKDGRPLPIAPGTESPVSIEEMIRRRDAWLKRNAELVKQLSVKSFLQQKKTAAEQGLL